jgi:hypothetical protein
MTKRKRVKKSELFDMDIEIEEYVSPDDLEGVEISAYSVTPDLGEDVIASVNDGYTILPSFQ